MKTQRRKFISQLSFITAITAVRSKPTGSLASISKLIGPGNASPNEVRIYHTNDLHGNLEPVFYGMGGLDHVKALLRQQETKGLLLDAGGFLNLSEPITMQRKVIQTMNDMGYHAATIGNDELALGESHLASLLPQMRFNLVNCNYRFDGELKNYIKPYLITYSGKFKIGITGVGHRVKGVKYADALASANKTADYLKKEQKCDLVICLSHLGHTQSGKQPDDRKLAASSTNIDMIISGHNRFLLRGPMILLNQSKKEVIVSQAAYNGLMMGTAVFSFKSGQERGYFKGKNMVAGRPTEQSLTDSFAFLKENETRMARA